MGSGLPLGSLGDGLRKPEFAVAWTLSERGVIL